MPDYCTATFRTSPAPRVRMRRATPEGVRSWELAPVASILSAAKTLGPVADHSDVLLCSGWCPPPVSPPGDSGALDHQRVKALTAYRILRCLIRLPIRHGEYGTLTGLLPSPSSSVFHLGQDARDNTSPLGRSTSRPPDDRCRRAPWTHTHVASPAERLCHGRASSDTSAGQALCSALRAACGRLSHTAPAPKAPACRTASYLSCRQASPCVISGSAESSACTISGNRADR